MGLIYNEFNEQVLELWKLASQIKHKPIHPELTWTCGFISGKGHSFQDLQIHALSMAASIIITEPIVPRIIISWDTPQSFSETEIQQSKKDYFPIIMMEAMGVSEKKIIKDKTVKNFKIETKYVDLIKHFHSCNTYPYSLGLGYRSKNHGLDYVKTKYGVIVDTDTISLRPCAEYLMKNVKRSPDSFCWTIAYKEELKQMNVGLVVFNMHQYNSIYRPEFNDVYWDLPRGDVYWIGNVFEKRPHLKDKLKVEIIDDCEMVSTGKYHGYSMFDGKTTFKEDKSLNYHAWKNDYIKNEKGFINTFSDILNRLSQQAKEQINAQT